MKDLKKKRSRYKIGERSWAVSAQETLSPPKLRLAFVPSHPTPYERILYRMNYSKLSIAEACRFIFTGGRITVGHYANIKRPVITVYAHRGEDMGKITEKQLNEILCSGTVDLTRTIEGKYSKIEYFEINHLLRSEMDHFCLTELLNELHNLTRKGE